MFDFFVFTIIVLYILCDYICAFIYYSVYFRTIFALTSAVRLPGCKVSIKFLLLFVALALSSVMTRPAVAVKTRTTYIPRAGRVSTVYVRQRSVRRRVATVGPLLGRRAAAPLADFTPKLINVESGDKLESMEYSAWRDEARRRKGSGERFEGWREPATGLTSRRQDDNVHSVAS